MKRYAIIIEQGKRNYSAYVPDLPGCVATGKTLDDVVANMRGAIEQHLDVLGVAPLGPLGDLEDLGLGLVEVLLDLAVVLVAARRDLGRGQHEAAGGVQLGIVRVGTGERARQRLRGGDDRRHRRRREQSGS